MRNLLVILGFLGAFSAHAQKEIFAMAIGNWRNGPVVYLTPVFATTEMFTTPQLLAQVKNEHEELNVAADVDVMRFATREEGEQHRKELKAKYGVRKLEVVLLDAPAKEEGAPAEH